MCLSKLFKKKTQTKTEEEGSSAYFHKSSTTHSTTTQSYVKQLSTLEYQFLGITLNTPAASIQSTPNLRYTDIQKQLSTSTTPQLIPNSLIEKRTIFDIDGILRSPFQPNYQNAFHQRNAVPYRSIQSAIKTPAASIQSSPNLRYTGTSNIPNLPTLSRRNSTPSNNTINNIIPTYEMKAERRGRALIINNVRFNKNIEERKGAEIDEINLKNLLEGMGFEVKSYSNLTVYKMKRKIKKFSKKKALGNANISVVALLSHGSNKKNGQTVPDNGAEVIGTDGKGLAVNKVLAKFTGENCKAMKGKPKIFIFQCCRGDRVEFQVDAVPFGVIKNHADMLIAYSTLPGFFSLLDPTQGSIYIQTLCQVFKHHSANLDVESLLKIVDLELLKKGHIQTSTYENRGFKRCFLLAQNCNN